MALLWTVVTVSCSIFLTPFLMFLLAIIFLASIGKSLGVRRLYVRILLKIFEYGRQHIEIARKDRQGSRDNSDDEAEIPDNGKNKPYANCNGTGPYKMNGFVPTSAGGVISRDDLILVPDPEQNINTGDVTPTESMPELPRRRSFETLKREFQLSDVLDYVKTGVEAIIEDQVTMRFEAEELKSWNLLTRTNHYYEFISWRLSAIWMVGFFVRYFFLLPLRILICFIGNFSDVFILRITSHMPSVATDKATEDEEKTHFFSKTLWNQAFKVLALRYFFYRVKISWMVFSTAILSFFPDGCIKRWLNRRAYLITFRILFRSLSGLLRFHNKEFCPRKSGVCVANHTSPIDVVILSTESQFSLVMWLTVCTGIVGYVPEGPFKRWLNHRVSIMCFGVLSSALSSVITYHNPENRPKNGICVANHTSPIDVLVLACDNCYALIGQRHGGFLGVLQRALARASPHIWFERSEVKDREAVAKRLREHVSDPNNPPILIFPEGTCINNTSVMQFKKGSFEVGGVIYPVAIKYDPKFGDAFWNSSRYSMVHYLYRMMTSWAIVCDVWYLPPMTQQPDESAIDFANRVKRMIARQGGLVDLMWDGQLKRMKPKKEWKEKQQEEFSKRLKVD